MFGPEMFGPEMFGPEMFAKLRSFRRKRSNTEGWTTAYDDLIREGTRGVNAIRMLRKGGWRVYSKVRLNSRAMLPPRLGS